MKSSRHVLRFLYREYFLQYQNAMPMAVTGIFLWVLYSVSPHSIVDSYAITMVFVFLVMVWVSLAYHDTQNIVAEQLIMLKLKSQTKTYVMQCAFLLLISIAFSLFLVLVPASLSYLRPLYKRSITVSDITIAVLLHSLAGYVGSGLGGILHPRIINNRLVTMFTAVLISLLCIIKPGIHTMLPFTTYITWALPPIAEFCTRFSNQSFFNVTDVLVTAVQLLVYGVILTSAKIALLVKNKF